MVANVKPHLNHANEYDYAQPNLQLVIADDKTAKMFHANSGKMTEDKDGYLAQNQFERSQIYVNETNYLTIDNVDLSSDG